MIMSLFKNKYRIESARLQNWDYASEGAYFITICTRDKIHYFGEVIDGRMRLSQVGIIADLMWHEIVHHTRNVELGEFVVMPNHVHGILILRDDSSPSVETLHATSPQPGELYKNDHGVKTLRAQKETLHATSPAENYHHHSWRRCMQRLYHFFDPISEQD